MGLSGWRGTGPTWPLWPKWPRATAEGALVISSYTARPVTSWPRVTGCGLGSARNCDQAVADRLSSSQATHGGNLSGGLEPAGVAWGRSLHGPSMVFGRA